MKPAHQKKNRTLSYAWVDKMGKMVVLPDQLARFLKGGDVRSTKGGIQ